MWNASVGSGVILLASALLLAALARTDNNDDSSNELVVGRAIDITIRFGAFVFFIPVAPISSFYAWMFDHPTVGVFQNVMSFSAGPEQHTKELSAEDIQIDFCDNITQLIQAYFQDYTIERLEQPWRAFGGSWKPPWIAWNLGLHLKLLFTYRYVLVRVPKYRETKRLITPPNNFLVKEGVSRAIQNISVGDSKYIRDFVHKYGSHYISSYTKGDSIFQIFVFERGVYANMKDQVKARGISSIPPAKLRAFFSPLSARYISPIQVASDNKDVASWVKLHLQDYNSNSSWPSIVKLYDELPLLKTLDKLLGNEVLLQLELKILSIAFKDVKKKKWFEQVLDNYLRLLEFNS